MSLPAALALLAGCWGARAYIVEGTVLEVRAPDEIVVDHEDIPGLMPAMVMPFTVAEPGLLADVRPGSRILARYELLESGSVLTELRVTGQGPAPEVPAGPAPLRAGERLPAFRIPTHDGGEVVLGPEQTERWALTFVYTRCPQPEFCPAMTARLAALQEADPGAHLLAVTLDPDHDSLEVLARHAAQVGAGPQWRYGRLEGAALADLAMSAGLLVMKQPDPAGGPEILAHGLRLVVLDRGGRLVERYDDAKFPLARVVEQLRTGGPDMPPGNSGTVTPDPEAP